MSKDLGDDVVGDAEEVTGEDLDILEESGAVVDQDDSDDGDERTTKKDTEMDDAKSEEERERIRARRREERKRRKSNQHEKVESLERMVETLAAQNRAAQEQLMRLQSSDASAKLGQLDAAISESTEHYNHFRNAFADATARNDGATAATALERMNQARDRYTQLTNVKETVLQAAKQPSPLDPTARNEAIAFAKRHSWYKGPGAKDMDSEMMTALDRRVAQDGYDPRTPAYWQELEARAKKYIPHRFDGASQGRDSVDNAGERRPRSPVGGSVSQRGNSGSTDEGGFRLSAERVKAMKEAGIWDDPKRRQKMIATYRAADRNA